MSHPRVAIGLGLGTSPPIWQTRALLRLARVMRLHSAWTVDHFLGFFPQQIWNRDFTWMARPGSSPHEYFDYQVLLGHLASRAGNVRLGVGVTEALRRHPVLIAQTFLSLSHLTKQPPILGIGAGERENLEPYGISFEQPVGHLEEALQIIRLCFRSRGPFDFSGKHYQLDGAVMDVQPGRGGVPEIWIGAHGPKMLRLVGTYGDGWYPSVPMTPDDYGTRLATIRSSAEAAGRDPDAITPSAQLIIVLGRSEEHARSLLDSRPLRYLALMAPASLWRERGASHPFGDEFRGFIDLVPQHLSIAELDGALASVPRSVLEDAMLWGTPEHVLECIRELADAGMRHAVLSPASAMVSRRDALFSIRAVLGLMRRLQSGY